MTELEKELTDKFGGRLRTRVNGILIENESILMIKHKMGPKRFFWNVPGGGMKYGSTVEENLKREFREETGLDIRICKFVCAHEYLETPLHAIELFFIVERTGGNLYMGIDPELDGESQLITDLKFLSYQKLQEIHKDEKHPVFWGIKSLNDVRKWNGYFNFENNSIK
ncbi:NUDIX hydrolase family protein [Indibacter alkaliphilus LW1]|jgi:8-oxo-dGTP diphosphatase|uniref:NUDIX hydrolase family protein n=1 Tax=Indibacter alkaliphilus (strain CCUG 57479 / KCTC 22604 / LW1) TaxID=1189612 RepID=S2D187_INDAL|nr:NUDIX domain-containing protein [Indibacter alkaliphilus]EOZ92629.1 NUDIX hydrolase family protein [Indibacter alkaliphilus LW1]